MLGINLACPAFGEDLLIIANPSVEVPAQLTFRQIAAIYLLRTTTWPDGSRIIPVNREADSTLRRKFSSTVVGLDSGSLASYWSEMHFQGKMPPVLQESEPAMLAFVQRVPGAVGYISAATAPLGVKVLSRVQ
jgi:ABC-type phosphate transport system substrate-binding protein